MPPNTAAWVLEDKARIVVKEAEYTPPGAQEIVIKNGAVAFNIVDWAKQNIGQAMFPQKYPTVLGSDVAGEIVEVGAGVTSFKPGERVLGCAQGFGTGRAADGAFQQYVVLSVLMSTRIPNSVSFAEAATLPLGVMTAASGLFQHDLLALRLPTVPAQPASGETVFIWSGSSSVGSNAIQLAVAAGYEVITTASPKNFDYVKDLGASQAFDHHSSNVVDDVVAAFKGKKSVGVLAIGRESTGPCIDIVGRIEGRRYVAMANQGPEKLPDGIEGKFYIASNWSGQPIFVDYLPKALASGAYKIAPEPLVIGHGLDSIQNALDTIVKGVSAKKLVVTL
ncbi:hypothetical protein B7494_g6814 [Chlorociboria aeruginascens]|nr:hypothetical protein B7494_g6814 [Chlorociboria aeruginascens]